MTDDDHTWLDRVQDLGAWLVCWGTVTFAVAAIDWATVGGVVTLEWIFTAWLLLTVGIVLIRLVPIRLKNSQNVKVDCL